MASARLAKAMKSHEERTATEPRDKSLHPVLLDTITPVNSRIKRYRFSIKDENGINFLPGQWLDVHVPGIEKAGGFTITSASGHAKPTASDDEHVPFLELAVQKSPDNPPAAWLWQIEESIVGKELDVRVGGSFVWPPPGVDMDKIKRAVFIAGGVGINPLISILSHIRKEHPSIEARFLYSTKVPSKDAEPSQVLFLLQLLDLFRKPRDEQSNNRLELFFTGAWDGSQLNRKDDEPVHPLMSLTIPKLDLETEVPVVSRTHRIDEAALSSAVGDDEQQIRASVFYVCGPPRMTDSIVEFLRAQNHVLHEQVLCEKWW
ncbi:hypothetical protein BDV95DRAFT_503427 [Massariosphaeria phaeospora]|uniref:FAD-binding FR-type domain-containing protein n=1 Tax=Massariosphaeria phaeospora TaxID=100035 RepID=A0A7C8M476_9PLEO|nr:hypothetical protein BDV95DRAFT_503427 [Massariosphaeria phaeospora]